MYVKRFWPKKEWKTAQHAQYVLRIYRRSIATYISRLFMAGDIRDRTGRYCFDMFGGKKVEGGTGRDGKTKKL